MATPLLQATARGSLFGDRTSPTRAGASSLGAQSIVKTREQYGAYNQAAAGTPGTSAYGRAFGLAARTGLIAQYGVLLPDKTGYRGLIGILIAPNAKSKALFAPRGYSGDMPLSQQPTVARQVPWLRAKARAGL